ncbi:MAG TPA: glycosyltransferase family 1 protein [Terracidiphilus sp.]|jgi:glycosyltransferase involved in cell wall biosynthesis|nr:glycosyltransferase family 1 protein [Terracidiphilus sp.]
MRVVLFTETFLPKIDGIVTTLCQTLRQLRMLGHEALVFAPEGGPDRFEGFRIVGMKSRSFPLYPELRLAFPHAWMRGVIADFKPDVLHVLDPVLLGVAGLYYGGGKDGGALRLPTVVSYHTDLPKYLRYYRLDFLEPHVWKILRLRHDRATINLCTSSAMVEQLRKHGIERVALWPGGVDADLFHPSRGSAAMRDRLTQGNPESPLLLYVGRLSAEKNLESLRPVLEAFPGVRLALVGDGPHRKSLQKHFANLPVYFAGFLEKEDLAGAYASSDIFVMPSRTETLGLVVLEAMCSGLPVVAARAGGIPEMIENGISGYVVDAAHLAIERIGDLLSSNEKRESMGNYARAHASRSSWRAATLQLVAQYEEACAAQALGPMLADRTAPAGMRARMRRALKWAALFTVRKLLP